MDLVSTLNHYERYRDEYDVTIIVSGTKENLQFLRSVNIPESSLRYIAIPSRKSMRKKHVIEFVRMLRKERENLDDFIKEINNEKVFEIIFHSYVTDLHAGYMVAQLSKVHRVTLVDVLDKGPQYLRRRQLLSIRGLKNLASHMIYSFVYGKIFKIVTFSGMPRHSLISLDLEDINIVIKPKSAGGTSSSLEEYQYTPEVRGKCALIFYANTPGVSESRHRLVYRAIVECLVRNGFQVLLKVHPQRRPPSFLEGNNVSVIPQYIPSELVSLSEVSLVVGLKGTSLLGTGNTPTVSLLEIMYDKKSADYKKAMALLNPNDAIQFVRSTDEFEDVVEGISAAVSRSSMFQVAQNL